MTDLQAMRLGDCGAASELAIYHAAAPLEMPCNSLFAGEVARKHMMPARFGSTALERHRGRPTVPGWIIGLNA